MKETDSGRLSGAFIRFNVAQFCGALNDNIFKLLAVLYLIHTYGAESASRSSAVAAAIFVVPFLLFSAAAGVLASAYFTMLGAYMQLNMISYGIQHLGLAVHCVSCSRIHMEKAKKMGISNAEIEEAAALAVAFAGCRALMLWNELKKELL